MTSVVIITLQLCLKHRRLTLINIDNKTLCEKSFPHYKSIISRSLWRSLIEFITLRSFSFTIDVTSFHEQKGIFLKSIMMDKNNKTEKEIKTKNIQNRIENSSKNFYWIILFLEFNWTKIVSELYFTRTTSNWSGSPLAVAFPRTKNRCLRHCPFIQWKKSKNKKVKSKKGGRGKKWQKKER